MKGKTKQCNKRSILLILFLFLNLINITSNIQQHYDNAIVSSDFNEKEVSKIDSLRNEYKLSKNSLREFGLSKKVSGINDGGNSFAEAVEISIGTTNDQFNDTDGYYEYYKVDLSVGSVIDFTLLGHENFILTIFNPSQSNLGSDSTGIIKHVEITVTANSYHYIELFRSSLTFEGNYNLTVSDPINGPDGEDSFISATEINIGTFSDNFTTNEQNEYFKVNLTEGYNVIINVFGECDDLYFYNGSEVLLERDPYDDPSIHLTITTTGYYYIRLYHSTSSWGVYTLTVTTEASGTILYVDGGSSFSTATVVSLGETQNRWTSAESSYYDYFKVYFNATDLVTFVLSSTSSSGFYLRVYDPSQTSIVYDYGSSTSAAQVIITIEISGYYYILADGSYSGHPYSLVISTTFYPSEPTNVQATYNQSFNTMIITWTDAPQSGLTYLIYMDTNPIESTSYFNSQIQQNSRISFGSAILTATKIGEVQSGVQRFEWEDPPEGTYYFLVIAENEFGLQSSVTSGISATIAGVNVFEVEVSSNPLDNQTSIDFGPFILLVVVLVIIAIVSLNYYSSSVKKKPAGVTYSPKTSLTSKIDAEEVKQQQKEFNEVLEISTINQISSYILEKNNGLISDILRKYRIDLRIVNRIVNNLLHSNPSLFTVYLNSNQDIFALISSNEWQKINRLISSVDGFQVGSICPILTSSNWKSIFNQNKMLILEYRDRFYTTQGLESFARENSNQIKQIINSAREQLEKASVSSQVKQNVIERLIQLLPVEPVLLPFYCQLDSAMIVKDDFAYACIDCNRFICSSCFEDMSQSGKSNCIFCGRELIKRPALQLEMDIEQVDQMLGTEFERFLVGLFRTQMYRVENIQSTGDHGVDLVILKGGSRIGVKAKRYKPNYKIGNDTLIQLKGSGHFDDCEKLIVVTTSYFTKKAKDYAKKVEIELWDRNTLKMYLKKFNKHLQDKE